MQAFVPGLIGAPRLKRAETVRAVAAAPSDRAAAPTSAPTPLWTPDSWRKPEFTAHQQPTYPDQDALHAVEKQLRSSAGLVSAPELHTLRKELADVAAGNRFILQGGDCAESLDETAEGVTDTVRALFKMAAVLLWGSFHPVVKIGRIGGQFAKPRSADTETVDGVTLPSYRGENINGGAFTEEARVPDPNRMLLGYQHSAGTTNMVRALSSGGFADLNNASEWGMDWAQSTERGRQYTKTAERITESLRFMKACGVGSENAVMSSTSLYTSHEGLLLPYEEALVRQDPITGEYYSSSGHFIWVGERTRQLDGAHVEFFRGLLNPIGVKAGPNMDPDTLIQLCDKLNPDNAAGRLTIVTRMGADKIQEGLPPLVRAIKKEGRNVCWVADPMHGNTFKSSSGYKTRSWDRIMDEVRGFFAVHKAEGSVAGGVHFEMTGKDVTECVGGMSELTEEQLHQRYESLCDPRLNSSQALELAFEVASMLRDATQ